MLSLDGELDQLRQVASRLGRTWEEGKIQDAILGISLYCRQTKEAHAQEVAQLRDEIRVLHGMLARREASNPWRQLLQGRSDLEEYVRAALDGKCRCDGMVVPVPSPLVSRAESEELCRFLAELQSAVGDSLVKLWTAKLVIVLRVAAAGEAVEGPTLPEIFQLNGTKYLIRARALQISSIEGERCEDFLKRIDDIGKSANVC